MRNLDILSPSLLLGIVATIWSPTDASLLLIVAVAFVTISCAYLWLGRERRIPSAPVSEYKVDVKTTSTVAQMSTKRINIKNVDFPTDIKSEAKSDDS